MHKDPVVIVGAARTPIGNFQGVFKNLTAPELGAAAIKAAVERSQLPADAIDEVLMGCVLSAGIGQAPARQAALGAGLALNTPCTTINKMCGSGMKSVMLAHDSIIAGSANIMVAGGMESMTNAPYLLAKARGGYRMGHQNVIDHMMYDGLEDAYQRGSAMGVFAEDCAQSYGFSREQQDQFAIASITRAQKASQDKSFSEEITPVSITTKEGNIIIEQDEGPSTARIEKIPQLRPAFRKDGTVTAANASSISDGAAALTLMRQSQAEKEGVKPFARIIAQASHAQEPSLFTTAPIAAIQKVLARANWSVADVDLFEINEAFAVVTMAAMQDLKIPHEKVNVHGGGCILGHPIGASGARILVTLLYALKQTGKKRGVAALCIGGGEATALAIELG